MTFKEFIGYDLHISRVAFEHEGTEIVFIHDFFILKRRIYIDGEQVFSRHSNCLGFLTDSDFSYLGNHYRVITRTLNFLSMKQDVTVWVNGVEAGRKIDPFYAALALKQKFHAAFGALGLGAVVGMLSALIF
ncbi:hypothetical protein NBRC116583_29430 [Arenicella sp. 4NH20-0111]|uniref:hypothetical protein n=1 Tax=Arenicella sp. 4NH20-0111 TaxID=3127648 RepID=UPI00310B71FF